jgi:hypothetical protein
MKRKSTLKPKSDARQIARDQARALQLEEEKSKAEADRLATDISWLANQLMSYFGDTYDLPAISQLRQDVQTAGITNRVFDETLRRVVDDRSFPCLKFVRYAANRNVTTDQEAREWLKNVHVAIFERIDMHELANALVTYFPDRSDDEAIALLAEAAIKDRDVLRAICRDALWICEDPEVPCMELVWYAAERHFESEEKARAWLEMVHERVVAATESAKVYFSLF